jgi:alpha-galactosidase
LAGCGSGRLRSGRGLLPEQAAAAEGYDFLPLRGFDAESRYIVQTRPQAIPIRRFGGLVKHILPVTLNPDGLIVRAANRFYRLTDCVEQYECRGDMLSAGLRLSQPVHRVLLQPQYPPAGAISAPTCI